MAFFRFWTLTDLLYLDRYIRVAWQATGFGDLANNPVVVGVAVAYTGLQLAVLIIGLAVSMAQSKAKLAAAEQRIRQVQFNQWVIGTFERAGLIEEQPPAPPNGS